MSIWRNRRRAAAAQKEAVAMKETAENLLETALEMESKVDAETAETVRFIRENHVQKKLQTTFRKGPSYGI